MARLFQLHASTRRPRTEALLDARACIDEAGALLTAINHFAEKASVLVFEARTASVQQVVDGLRRRGMSVHGELAAATAGAALDAQGETVCTLQLLYAGDELARVDDIPAVPG
jgi:siroheme synthase